MPPWWAMCSPEVTAMAEQNLTPSSNSNPCPICGRTEDGDCRISSELILCHWGENLHSPHGLKPGQVIPGHDGQQWAYTRDASDGRTAVFVLDKKRDGPPRRLAERRPQATATAVAVGSAKPLPIDASGIALARLPGPLPEPPPAHLPDGHQLDYSPTQRVMVKRATDGGKAFPVQHFANNGETATWAKGAGPDPWPLWRQAEAIQHGPGRWIAEAEGEKCADWLRAGGLVAISQPGHAHKPEQIQQRYRALQQADIRGIVYLADNDAEGSRRSDLSEQAAAAIGLPFLALPAGEVWPGIAGLGSIDDAPGPAAERAQALIAEIPDAIAQQQASLAEQQGDKPSRLTKADLQAFLQATYRLEFNELTRDCEIDGTPMGSRLHLADSFLAKQHGLEVSKQAAADSFEFVAKSNPYNPVRRYLLGLRERTDLCLISMGELARAFGIHSTDDLSHQMLAAHLAGAVHRGLSPGYKHDQMLIFSGPQGNRKSSSIEALSPPGWYDSATKVSDLESKDVLAKINSAWIFEFDECEHTLQKSTASEFKGFITRRTDNYVEKYEKQSTRHDRRGVLFGTTNQSEFLNDSTGNRRIWIIDTEGRPLDHEWIATNRDSVWATVMTWIDWGLQSWISVDDKLAIAAAARAEQANLSDPWEGALAAVLETRPIDSEGGITQQALIEQALRLPIEAVSRDIQMRVARVVNGSNFRTHGGTIRWTQQRRRYGGGRQLSGYMPELLGERPAAVVAPVEPTRPTNPTIESIDPTILEGVGSARMPWLDRRLTALYQPEPTFHLSGEVVKEKRGASAHWAVDGAVSLSGQKGCLRLVHHQTPSAAVGLPEPSAPAALDRLDHRLDHSAPEGDGSSATAADPQPLPGTDAPASALVPATAPLVDQLVEILEPSGWKSGYRVTKVDADWITLQSPGTGRTLQKKANGNQGPRSTWRLQVEVAAA